ncbi:M48 family metallopeptidase [Tranquillimonas alkanivorans]|uniref:Peptidase family M48 n=1 Tax=Tranquillimonas alkanivorans TaxID=441119 RepID=A0A1I5U2P0_9RHOB|nr:M48 family metallopeptidase [Tranquillimonas alkanivorans]SFP89560.1 Peptidase family M48 [Tranquillimonas alkanivorans]
MCGGCGLSRRKFLTLSAAGAVPIVSGCDRVNLVSDEEVVAMGLQAWQELRADAPPSGNREAARALEDVANRLLAAAGEAPEAWEVVLFARPDINAFALPGNKIGVFEGMLKVTRTQDQLAAVVGHEIGHLAEDHGQERMNAAVAKDRGLSILYRLLQWGGVEYAAEIAAALGLGVEFGLVLPYSRRHELEADRYGILAMQQAGYDPRQAVELWRNMDAATGRRLPEFLATHPAPASRIEEIEELLVEI